MWAVPDAVAFLAGTWRITRRIRDRRLGMHGSLTGLACFAPVADGLRYEERGVLRLGDWQGEVSRELRYVMDGGGRLSVRFADGRPFHDLDLSAGEARVAHDCAPDRYRGGYRVFGPDAWSLAWCIQGPRKHVAIGTRYTRTISSVKAS